MRRDDDKQKRLFLLWKEKCEKKIPGLTELNSEIILNYINDMEYGLNVGKSSKKGGRSYNRLYNLQQRMIFITKLFEKNYNIKDLTKIEDQQRYNAKPQSL